MSGTTTNEVAVHDGAGSQLAIEAGQSGFTPAQRSALMTAMNLDPDTPQATIDVFFHRCQTTRLDPFLGQIYLIGRGKGEKRTYTIQTGIDGFRVIGHRTATAAGEEVSMSSPEWMGDDGQWRQGWSVRRFGPPLAARVTITRAGQPFPAVVNYDEYVQTKFDGSPNSMWATMPANQLAKCAEAAAWRKAYPYDMAGIFVDEEMQQADSEGGGRVRGGRRRRVITAATLQTVSAAPDDDVVEGEHVQDDDAPAAGAVTAMRSAFNVVLDADEHTADGKRLRLDYMTKVLARTVESTKDLTADDVARVTSALREDATDDDSEAGK